MKAVCLLVDRKQRGRDRNRWNLKGIPLWQFDSISRRAVIEVLRRARTDF